MEPAREFDYKGRRVAITTMVLFDGWGWSYTIDDSLPTMALAGALDSEVEALVLAAKDARRRIDAMAAR
jgi:hypothetical protein